MKYFFYPLLLFGAVSQIIKKRRYIFFLFIFFSVFFPFVISLHNIITGSIPFWYDPARDLLLALKNTQKLTLIGPPSGIPGIFYGPYWIWLLSLGLFISKDPRVVSFLVLTVPYFTLFPFFLYKTASLIKTQLYPPLVMLFLLSFGSYTTAIWNPHLSPLFLLIGIYFFLVSWTKLQLRYRLLHFFISGIAIGFSVQLQISFGIGLVVGIFIYFLVEYIQQRKKYQVGQYMLSILFFLGGICLTFFPFFFFEIRHGFHQVQTLLTAFLTKGAIISLHGLTAIQIIQEFFFKLAQLLEIPNKPGIIVGIALLLAIGEVILRKKSSLEANDTRLVKLLSCISISVLTVYLLSKNPVWNYHFINVEMLWVLFLLFLVKQRKFFALCLFFWVGVVCIMQSVGFVRSFTYDITELPVLISKENVVDTILSDTENTSYAVAAYDPAIYAYDYEYLLSWQAGKSVTYDPKVTQKSDEVYLVIPKTTESIKEDFIHYQTPDTQFITIRIWNMHDGTHIIKRIKNKTP